MRERIVRRVCCLLSEVIGMRLLMEMERIGGVRKEFLRMRLEVFAYA